MSTRTTRGQLQAQVDQLNKALNRPLEPWRKGDAPGCRANIGNLHLDHNIGGWQVQEMCNEGGGVTCPLGDYRFSAGELWHVLRAAIGAVEMARKGAQ